MRLRLAVRLEYGILALFILMGIGFWFLDAAVDAYFFHGTSFIYELRNFSPEQIYIRSATFAAFFSIGLVVSKEFSRRRLAQDKTQHLNLVLSTMRQVDRSLSRSTDRGKLIQQVCNDLVSHKAYRNAWITTLDGNGGAIEMAEAGLKERFIPVADSIKQGQFPTCMRKAMGQGGVVVVEGPQHNCPGCSLATIYRGTGSLVARLEHGLQIYGVLTVALDHPLAAEGQEQSLFLEVAAEISAALHHIEVENRRLRAERELELSRRREEDTGFKIQQMLLFQRPPEDICGASIAAITIPSQQVDGDFYDFFKFNDQVFDVIIADVMGKGTTAALLGAATKSHFMRAITHLNALAPGAIPQPQEVVSHVHKEMTRRLIDIESFVTVFYARFDMTQGKLIYVDCGHPKPILFRAGSGACEMLAGENLFLGADERETYQQTSVDLHEGDLVLMYSDGVIDAENKQRDFFGVERLCELAARHGQMEPVQMLDKIIMELISFASSEGPSDDLTCVAVKVEPALETIVPMRAELDILSEPEELSRVRGFVLALGPRLGKKVNDHDLNRLELAVNEAVSNIMRHAYHGQRDRPIHIEAEVRPTRAVVRLFHWGQPYDPHQALAKRPDKHIGGYGLSIISQCVNHVRYIPAGQGKSCVELVKSFAKL